ncbi:MAG: metallophosphoesterase [Pseudomonadota bacterium]
MKTSTDSRASLQGHRHRHRPVPDSFPPATAGACLLSERCRVSVAGRLLPVLLLLVGFSLAFASCQMAGDLAAGGTGDISNAAAERSSATAALVTTCGDGALTPAGQLGIVREPYVQQVTDRSALIVWTSSSVLAGNGMTVEVTTAAGEPLRSAVASVDDSAAPEGAIQLVARVEGLVPATTYCYQIREGNEPLVASAGFRTAPDTGGGAPVRFVAFGDSGWEGPDQLAVLAQIETVPFDLILHTGDVSQGEGTRQELEDFFFAVYVDLLHSFPVFPAIGGHDYRTEDGAPFLEAFVLPENGAPNGTEHWYSYDWGNVHFVVFDTQRWGSEQMAWLEADLAANELPWIVAYGHEPPYSSGQHGSTIDIQRRFSPIFEKHQVALVLSGHDHDYERTNPIGGVTYVVTGGGGRGTRPVGTSAFTAYSEAVLHFVYVVVEGDTLVLHAIDGVGREFDSALIHRPMKAGVGSTELRE